MHRTWNGAITVAAAALAGALSLSPGAAAQVGGVGGMSHGGLDSGRSMNQIKDPAQQAADAYSRGAKYMRKAEKEKDAKDKAKLYQKAKDELTKSVGYQQTYDALLALGQVSLALDDRSSAATYCAQAGSLKPSDAAAQACVQTASAPAAATTTATAAPPPAPPPLR